MILNISPSRSMHCPTAWTHSVRQRHPHHIPLPYQGIARRLVLGLQTLKYPLLLSADTQPCMIKYTATCLWLWLQGSAHCHAVSLQGQVCCEPLEGRTVLKLPQSSAPGRDSLWLSITHCPLNSESLFSTVLNYSSLWPTILGAFLRMEFSPVE